MRFTREDDCYMIMYVLSVWVDKRKDSLSLTLAPPPPAEATVLGTRQ